MVELHTFYMCMRQENQVNVVLFVNTSQTVVYVVFFRERWQEASKHHDLLRLFCTSQWEHEGTVGAFCVGLTHTLLDIEHSGPSSLNRLSNWNNHKFLTHLQMLP